MHMKPCAHCDRRSVCREPCEYVKSLLPAVDRGRAPDRRTQPDTNREEVDLLLQVAPTLKPKTQAIIYLYYRAGFSLEQIATALGINRSSVWRRIRVAWRRAHRATRTQNRRGSRAGEPAGQG